MDLIDEEHVTFFEIRQQPGEVAGFFDGRPAGAFEIRAHRFGENVRERRFAQPGGPLSRI
jgi:hypothetical protein